MVRIDTSPEHDRKGNEADDNNVAQRITDNKFKRASQSVIDATFNRIAQAESSGTPASNSGSLDDASAEDRREAVSDSEEAGQDESSYYSSEADSPYQGNDLKSRLLRMKGVKNKGATTGIGASILFVGGIMLSMATGSSFWTAFEKNLTNDASDDSRINTILHRAFNNLFAHSCKPGSLTCKFKTMTKEQVKKWKEGFVKIKGQVVDERGNPIRGGPDTIIDPDNMKDGERVQAEKAVFSDGVEVDNARDLNSQLETDVKKRSNITRAFSRASSFVHGKFATMLSEKYKISKGSPSPEEKKTNNAQESVRTAISDAEQKASGTLKTRALKALTSSSAQFAQLGIDYACMAYNTTRIAVGTVKAKWALDLIRFAYPFVRLASKVADGSATNEDFQQIEDKFTQLVDYLSPRRAIELKEGIDNNALTDVDKRELKEFGLNPDEEDKNRLKGEIDEITNKNAFDSQGLQMAIYGDSSGLVDFTDFTKKFSTGVVGSGTLFADYIVKQLQGAAELGMGGGLKTGNMNIRSFCKANKALGSVMAAGGLAESGLDIAGCIQAASVVGNIDPTALIRCGKRAVIMATKLTAWIAGFILVGKLMTAALTAAIVKYAPELPSDTLRGPAAGDAIASGIALLLSHKAMSSGLKPAMSTIAVNQFIASTQKHYDTYNTELAYYNARQTPFDVNNRYSFAGQIVNALNPYQRRPNQPDSPFAYITNVLGVVSNMANNTAQAYYSQPSLMTLDEANLKTRTNNGDCESDEEKQQLEMLCDGVSGRTIQVASPRVLQWAEEDAAGKSDHLAETIAWMSKPQGANEAENGGGTQDETCTGIMSKIMDIMTLEWGNIGKCSDSGELASIDPTGAPVKGSQYEKYVNYCREKRELEYGSTDIDQSTGSAKEQAWHDASQCALTYDSHGHASTGDEFHKEEDTGKGSMMMDRFTYYYNMCYIQYAIQNNATDCTNDKPPTASLAASTTQGNGSIADTAKEMGAWGSQYQSCYVYGGGHGKSKEWIEQAIANHFAGEYAVDCSAFVRAVVLQATGNDIGDVTTQTLCSDAKNWERIPRNQAQSGDLAIDCVNHVEVITDVNGGSFKTVGSHTTGCGPGYGASPGTYQGTESFVLRYKG